MVVLLVLVFLVFGAISRMGREMLNVLFNPCWKGVSDNALKPLFLILNSMGVIVDVIAATLTSKNQRQYRAKTPPSTTST